MEQSQCLAPKKSEEVMFKVSPEHGHCKQQKEGMLLSPVLNASLQDIKWLLDRQANFVTAQWWCHSKAEELSYSCLPDFSQVGILKLQASKSPNLQP